MTTIRNNLICTIIGKDDLDHCCLKHLSPELDQAAQAVIYNGCTRFVCPMDNSSEVIFASLVLGRFPRARVEAWIRSPEQLKRLRSDPFASSVLSQCEICLRPLSLARLRGWQFARADYIILVQGNNCPHVAVRALTNS